MCLSVSASCCMIHWITLRTAGTRIRCPQAQHCYALHNAVSFVGRQQHCSIWRHVSVWHMPIPS